MWKNAEKSDAVLIIKTIAVTGKKTILKNQDAVLQIVIKTATAFWQIIALQTPHTDHQ